MPEAAAPPDGWTASGTAGLLRCPLTNQPLRREVASSWLEVPHHRVGQGPFPALPPGDALWCTVDGDIAYPDFDGMPILLAPEARSRRAGLERRTDDPRYLEAYEEMAVYGARAARAIDFDRHPDLGYLRGIRDLVAEGTGSFPNPPERWLGRGSTIGAQAACFAYLAPVEGQRVLQVGGSGLQALLLLLVGASEAVLLSPVVDELRLARALAGALGLGARLVAVGGIAEELPLADRYIARAYSGSSIHHTQTERSFAELARVLEPGGRVGTVDVWKAPLHGFGTRLFGKAGGNPHCRPLDDERLAPVHDHFAHVQISHHGAVARYLLAVLHRIGVRPPARLAWRLAAAEDRLAARFPLLARQASLVAVRAGHHADVTTTQPGG